MSHWNCAILSLFPLMLLQCICPTLNWSECARISSYPLCSSKMHPSLLPSLCTLQSIVRRNCWIHLCSPTHSLLDRICLSSMHCYALPSPLSSPRHFVFYAEIIAMTTPLRNINSVLH